MAPSVTVWLAGTSARAQFVAEAQTAADLARWRDITSPRRREEWEISRALLAHVRSAPRVQAPHALERHALSLSHSGGYAAVAASQSALRVGVDLECARVRDVERVARFAFSERELAQLLALPAEARAERFYILWTLKEAFAKALSLPLMASLSQCTFSEERGTWCGDVPSDCGWIARTFQPAPTLVLSVVALPPESLSPENYSVFVQEWPEPAARSWRSLVTLHSGRA